MPIRRVDAVLIDSPDAPRLAAFYRDRLGLPLVEELHGGPPHWACGLEGLHFAIHTKDVKGAARPVALSFQVDDVDALAAALSDVLEMAPQDRPYGRLAAVRDPDGNLIYLHR